MNEPPSSTAPSDWKSRCSAAYRSSIDFRWFRSKSAFAFSQSATTCLRASATNASACAFLPARHRVRYVLRASNVR
jgi:hypothetical protein